MLLSVVVITYNEEKNIGRCLQSVAGIADEILVIDSSSNDNTIAIAQSFNARVIKRSFTGYSDQKNFGSAQARHDWILSLDADEALTDKLKASLMLVKDKSVYDVYDMPRITNYCGKWIRYCGWYPDYQTRLYNRTKGAWVALQVHEYWQPNNQDAKKGRLNGDLLHYSFASISEQIKKIEKYSELASRDAVSRGKQVSLFKVWLSPKWHFFTEFFLKLGFLEGYTGYVICKMSAYAAFIKYSKIRMYGQNSKSHTYNHS